MQILGLGIRIFDPTIIWKILQHNLCSYRSRLFSIRLFGFLRKSCGQNWRNCSIIWKKKFYFDFWKQKQFALDWILSNTGDQWFHFCQISGCRRFSKNILQNGEKIQSKKAEKDKYVYIIKQARGKCFQNANAKLIGSLKEIDWENHNLLHNVLK